MSPMCQRSVVRRPCRRLRFDVVSDETPAIHIRADELRTVREAMRDLGSLLTELEDGDVEKLVLTQRNRMRAVVVSLEHWSKVERALAGKNVLQND
jgi:arginine/ornithine N-succinyltransferase beta subunit